MQTTSQTRCLQWYTQPANKNLYVIQITEAELKQKLPDVTKGYNVAAHERTEYNRGSVMWVKDYYHERMVRVYDPEDKNIGSEIIHLLLDTLPPTNIMGVYQETGITFGTNWECPKGPTK